MEANKKNGWGIAALCHLSALIFGLFGPLVVWLIWRSEYPFVDKCGKEALNFNISYTFYIILATLLMVVLIGFILLPLVIGLWLIFIIAASVKASKGKYYRYPLTIRFIK
jgi:uncharacterized Tic20 family protein